jgi:hypothetical protein
MQIFRGNAIFAKTHKTRIQKAGAALGMFEHEKYVRNVEIIQFERIV